MKIKRIINLSIFVSYLLGSAFLLWIAHYTPLLKALLIIEIVLVMVFGLIFQERIALFVLVVIIFNNVTVGFKYYYPFIGAYGASYNNKCGLMTAQTAYSYDRGCSDLLFSTIIRGHVVKLQENSIYRKYAGLFSNIEIIESTQEPNYERIKSLYLDFGVMVPNSLDFYYEDVDDKTLDILYENKPHIYVSSNEVVDSDVLVILDDDHMNLYIMSENEYGSLIQ